MIDAIQTQPWALLSAGIFLLLLARALWSLLRAKPKGISTGRLEVLPLTPAETARFTEAWSSLQRRFAENPEWTVDEAEQLAREVMRKRGYPTRDSEAIADDHPGVMANYRAARAI